MKRAQPLILVYLSLFFVTSVSQAGWLVGGNTFFTNAPTSPTVGANISFGVYEADSGPETLFGVDLDDGEFGYFYQVVNAGPGTEGIEFFTIELDSARVNDFGMATSGTVLADADGVLSATPSGGNRGLGADSTSLSPFNTMLDPTTITSGTGTTKGASASLSPTSLNFAFGTPITIPGFGDFFIPSALAKGAVSSILFFTSNENFGWGAGDILFPPAGSSSLPVPVPLPAALGLVLAGIPVLPCLRRRRVA